jgi:hypothetical protein
MEFLDLHQFLDLLLLLVVVMVDQLHQEDLVVLVVGGDLRQEPLMLEVLEMFLRLVLLRETVVDLAITFLDNGKEAAAAAVPVV